MYRVRHCCTCTGLESAVHGQGNRNLYMDTVIESCTYMNRVRECCTWTEPEKAVHGHGQRKLDMYRVRE